MASSSAGISRDSDLPSEDDSSNYTHGKQNASKTNFLKARHKTAPNILAPPKHGDFRKITSEMDIGGGGASSSPRKSFLGEIMNILSFNKKKVDPEPESVQGNSAHVKQRIPANDSLSRGKRRAEFFGNTNKQYPLSKEIKGKSFASISKNKTAVDIKLPKTSPSKLMEIANTVNTLQMSIKKWKLMKSNEQKRETIAKNPEHQKLLDEMENRFRTEVPHPLQLVIKEEALQVSVKTMQMYRSMLGNKHQLTKEAQEHINRIKVSLYGANG